MELLAALGLIFAQLPPVSVDSRGYKDSPVNLLFIGSEAAMRKATSEWKKDEKGPVTEAFPAISPEFLFGRAQDLAFYRDTRFIRSRHHFRLWRAPFTGPLGEPVWVGTANFDADLAYGNNDNGTCGPHGFFHRIDPDIDAERAYISDSLLESGAVSRLRLEAHPKGVTSGVDSNCTPYRTDGKVLTVFLTD